MAIVKMDLPQCDSCGEVWLPDKHIRDKSTHKLVDNPARQNPKLCKRCGKCKTPAWNKGISADRTAGNSRQETSPAESNEETPLAQKPVANGAGLEMLYGIFEEEFKALGGGEAFLKAERAAWGPDPWEKVAMGHKARPKGGK